MLLGRTLWRRNEAGWRHETLALAPDFISSSADRLRACLTEARRDKAVLIYEPDGLAHDGAETPNVSRRDFAKIARIRDDYPAVTSEHLAWGMEPPGPAPGGTYSTVVHSEMTPGLIALRRACAEERVRLVAAWSAYTVAMSILPAGRNSGRGHSVLFLLPDYVGLARTGGAAPIFKGWTGVMKETDWAEASALLGEAGLAAHGAPPAGTRRPKGTMVVAAGGQERRCPFWDELISGGKVSALLGPETLADAALGLPASHPANLAEAFPRPIRLNAGLGVAAAASLAGVAMLGIVNRRDEVRSGRMRDEVRAEQATLEARLARLAANERRIELLHRDEKIREDLLPTHEHEVLAGLAAVVPDAVTLTSLKIHRAGDFEFEAMVVDEAFNSKQMQSDLERAGFFISAGAGWTYDTGARRIKGQGHFRPSKT